MLIQGNAFKFSGEAAMEIPVKNNSIKSTVASTKALRFASLGNFSKIVNEKHY